MAILGTPGGSRIITMVLGAMLALFEGEADPKAWVARPRLHHQYLPDLVSYEVGALDADQELGLVARSHQLKALDGRYGNMQAIHWDRNTGLVRAASDPRGGGSAEVR